MKLLIPLIAIIFTTVLLSLPAQASSMRCKGFIIKPGDKIADIEKRCGQPLLKNDFRERIKEIKEDGTEKISITYIEQYLYHPDEGSFLRLVSFKNGELSSVASLSSRGETYGKACDRWVGKSLKLGVPDLQVFHFCGAPSSSSIVEEEYVTIKQKKNTSKLFVTEEWSYPAGVTLVFRNKKLSEIRNDDGI